MLHALDMEIKVSEYMKNNWFDVNESKSVVNAMHFKARERETMKTAMIEKIIKFKEQAANMIETKASEEAQVHRAFMKSISLPESSSTPQTPLSPQSSSSMHNPSNNVVNAADVEQIQQQVLSDVREPKTLNCDDKSKTNEANNPTAETEQYAQPDNEDRSIRFVLTEEEKAADANQTKKLVEISSTILDQSRRKSLRTLNGPRRSIIVVPETHKPPKASSEASESTTASNLSLTNTNEGTSSSGTAQYYESSTALLNKEEENGGEESDICKAEEDNAARDTTQENSDIRLENLSQSNETEQSEDEVVAEDTVTSIFEADFKVDVIVSGKEEKLASMNSLDWDRRSETDLTNQFQELSLLELKDVERASNSSLAAPETPQKNPAYSIKQSPLNKTNSPSTPTKKTRVTYAPSTHRSHIHTFNEYKGYTATNDTNGPPRRLVPLKFSELMESKQFLKITECSVRPTGYWNMPV